MSALRTKRTNALRRSDACKRPIADMEHGVNLCGRDRDGLLTVRGRWPRLAPYLLTVRYAVSRQCNERSSNSRTQLWLAIRPGLLMSCKPSGHFMLIIGESALDLKANDVDPNIRPPHEQHIILVNRSEIEAAGHAHEQI